MGSCQGFVERSYKIRRGKIINVSKDGFERSVHVRLLQRHLSVGHEGPMQAGVSNAVVDVGRNYNG